MKIKLLVLFFFCAISFSNAQINLADSTVQVVSYWGLNESYNYEIAQKSYTYTDGNLTKADSTKMRVNVSVIDSTENSYTIKWKFTDYDIKGLEQVPELEKLLKERQFIYRINELGSFEELLNWEEIRDNTKAITDISFGLMNLTDSIKTMVEAISGPINTKHYIETKGIEAVQLFHTFMEAALTKGETLEFDVPVPNNFFPDQPFMAKGRLWLDEIYPEEDAYIIRYEQQVDKEQLNTFLKAYMKKLAEATGKEWKDIDNIFENNDMEHSTKTSAAIDDWGWPIYMETITSVDFVNMHKEQIITIELLDEQ